MTKKKKATETEIENWMYEISQLLVQENLRIIKDCPKPESDIDLSRTLLFNYLSSFIATLVYHSLTKHNDKDVSKQEGYELTRKSYNALKLDVQNSVAEAFEAAFEKSSDEKVEYYCSIAPIPDLKPNVMH